MFLEYQYYKYLQIWLPQVAYLLALQLLKVVYIGDVWNGNCVDSGVSPRPAQLLLPVALQASQPAPACAETLPKYKAHH